jgi:hypothetical protein
MTAGPATRSSRLLAVGLFIGLPAIFAALGVLNLLQVADDRVVLAEKEMQVAAFTRRLNAPAADGKPLDLSPIYLKGSSRTLASANLQQYVVDAISATSGKLIETVPVDLNPGDEAERADEIHLKATLDIDNAGLLQLLYKLESGVPLLDIETLSIRKLPNDAAEGATETLRIDMAIRGRWRQSAA